MNVSAVLGWLDIVLSRGNSKVELLWRSSFEKMYKTNMEDIDLLVVLGRQQ